MTFRGAIVLMAVILGACGEQASPSASEPPPVPVGVAEERPVGPDMTIADWRAASPHVQATYFRGAVSVHITDPARNETQRRFDDDLALDLRDCVNAEIEQNEPASSDSVRPFIARCMQASGMPAPG